MTREVAKAINAVSEKVNEIDRKLDKFFTAKYEENAAGISELEEYSAELLCKMCLLQLGITEEELVEVENTEESEV